MLYRTIKPLIVDAIQVKESKEIVTEGGLLHVKAGDGWFATLKEILWAVMTSISNARMNHWRMKAGLKTCASPGPAAAEAWNTAFPVFSRVESCKLFIKVGRRWAESGSRPKGR